MCRDDAAPSQHPDPTGRTGRAARARPGPDVHLRTDRLPLRPRRQPAQQPPGRPDPADAALPRHRRLPRQEHHRRRPPARRGLRPRRGPDARRRRPRAQDARPRSPTRTRRRSTPTRPLVNILPAHVFPRATEHIPEMLALAEALEDAGHAYATAEGNVYYDVGRFAGLRPAVGQHARPTCAPATAATSSRTSATRPTSRCGRRPGEGRLLKWPTPRWGEGFPGWHLECSAMAMRYLGAAVRHPHRRHRQRLPPPRGRDRPVGADRRRRPGPPLGPRRVPADGRQEDGQVGRQLPARHRARRPRASTRWRSGTSC